MDTKFKLELDRASVLNLLFILLYGGQEAAVNEEQEMLSEQLIQDLTNYLIT